MRGREFTRAERIGDQIQRELADLIARELSDPRLGRVTLSGVDVSRDLGNARVLVTPGSPEKAADSLAALNRASGLLRHRLGQRLRMRYVPRLHFEYDATLDEAMRISALIDSAVGDGGGDAAPRGEDDDGSGERTPGSRSERE